MPEGLNIPSIPEYIIKSLKKVLDRLFELHVRYTSNPSSDLRKILILNQFPNNIEDIEKKPSIIITRGQFSWRNSSINRLFNRQYNITTSVEFLSGGARFSVLSHSFAEAEDIASYIFSIFMIFRQQLNLEKFLKIESVILGATAPRTLASGHSVMECPVDVSITTAIMWTMEPKGPLLEVVTIDLTEKMEAVAVKEQFVIK
ncbi:MAG: hypothetical protein QXP66_00905 [Candidatus Aenigmatarchaeota archaeon]